MANPKPLGVFHASEKEQKELLQLCVENTNQIDAIIDELSKARNAMTSGQAARVTFFLPPGYYIPYSGKQP